MKVRILITLKNGVLDTQGKAIENVLNKELNYSDITHVRQGKVIEFEISDDNKDVKKIVDDICDKFLVNKVIEDYKFEIVK